MVSFHGTASFSKIETLLDLWSVFDHGRRRGFVVHYGVYKTSIPRKTDQASRMRRWLPSKCEAEQLPGIPIQTHLKKEHNPSFKLTPPCYGSTGGYSRRIFKGCLRSTGGGGSRDRDSIPKPKYWRDGKAFRVSSVIAIGA